MSDGKMTYEDWLRGCVHHDGRHGYVTLPCDEVLKIADFIERLRADRKTENSSEKPNNCEYAENPSGDVWECGCFLDTYCEHQIYDRNPDGTINIVECGYEPKTEPTISKMEQVDRDINVRSKDEPKTQMKTQNSNFTFKTLEYCDICDHKGCEECIANALDEHCIPSQFKKKVEDECAKEYEELGLKELKELIEADRKTESNSEKPNNCEDLQDWKDRMWAEAIVTEPQPTTDCRQTDCYMCKWLGEVDVCGRCRNRNLFCEAEPQPRCPKCGERGYIRSLESMGVKLKVFDEYKWKCTNCNKYFKEEPKDEPQTRTDEDGRVWEYRNGNWWYTDKNEPQTDCAWK